MRLFFFILTICILSYSNTFHAAWHLDDILNITSNKNIHISSLDLSEINNALRASPASSEGSLYRPLACLTLGLNWYISQDNVFSYHVVNLAIHIITAWFLFLSLYLLLRIHYQKEYPPQFYLTAALLAALFWASAPIQTQAVTYIVQRMASMAAMFSILAIYTYLRGRIEHRGKNYWFILCLISSFAALGSKENAILLFPSLVLVECSFFQRSIKKEQAVYLILGLLVILTTFLAFIHYGLGGNIDTILNGYSTRIFTVSERMLTQPRIILMYLSQIFIPVAERLSIEHDIILSTSLFSPWTTLPAILLVLLLITISFFLLKKYPLICFPVLFFFFNHAVESTFIPLEMFFEHRNYLPSFFLFLPAGVFIAHILYSKTQQTTFRRTTVAGCTTLFLIISAHATYTRNTAWATEESLWSDALRKSPNSARTLYMVALLHQRNGQSLQAYHGYQLALRKADKSLNHISTAMKAACFNGLGSVGYNMGFYEPALQYYNKCLDLKNDHEMCLRNRSMAYLQLGQPEKSFDDAAMLTKLYPEILEYQYIKFASSYYNDDIKVSMKNLQQNAGLFISQHEAMYLAGMLMMREESYSNSLFFLKQANKLSPNTASYQLALAVAYYASNQVMLAKKTIQEVLSSHSLSAIEKSLKKDKQYALNNNAINFIEKTITSLLSSNQLFLLKNAKKTK